MKRILKGFLKKYLSKKQVAILNGDKEFFSIVEIETTTECNRKCEYCPNSISERGEKKNKRLMSVELFKSIINQLSELDYRGKLHPHFYGEPFLDLRLIDLLTYARHKLPFAKIGVFSNGDFLTLDLYKRLEELKIDRLKITNHSKKIQKNIEEILNYRIYNKYFMEFDYITFDSFLNRGGLIITEQKKKMTFCMQPSRYLTIDYEGNLVLCCNDYFSSVKFGNLQKQKLLEICNDTYYKKTRREIRKGIFKFQICKKCNLSNE